jgi:hypothetical protein
MAEIKDKENTLILETTKGRAVIALRPDLAPNHVARIKELAREGFYDGIVFHRVIDGFMAQTGDPTGTGRRRLLTRAPPRIVVSGCGPARSGVPRIRTVPAER